MAATRRRARRPPPEAPENTPWGDVVWHPRYGNTLVASGSKLTEADIRASFYRHRDATIAPESAIAADPSRQNFSTFPRGCYVDILKVCRDCQRSFVFDAREQQHWYEVLGFYVDADCVRCPPCRRERQTHRRTFARYAELVALRELTDTQLAQLADDAVFLWKTNVLRDLSRLRWIANRARRSIPHAAATARIEKLVAGLGSQKAL